MGKAAGKALGFLRAEVWRSRGKSPRDQLLLPAGQRDRDGWEKDQKAASVENHTKVGRESAL